MNTPKQFTFNFPDFNNQQVSIPLTSDSVVFVLGANGTGKSGLMHKLFSQNHGSAKRISAHRQTWFTSNTLDFTPSNKVRTEKSITNEDNNLHSRWQDSHHSARLQVTIFNLINAQNERARKIADAVDTDDANLVLELKKQEAPLKTLNHLLRLSNLPIEISVEEDEKLFASKNGGEKYSIAELSDGERNAILIAADVLTAKPGMLFVIDEPERHLHRSIISPLLNSLFQKRTDCAFVIATHDISLPMDNPDSSTLVVRDCKWNGNSIIQWDTDFISSALNLDYQIKQDILGARRTLLFVEGTQGSLDQHVYSILFPEASVIPQGNCLDVERAVYGIAATEPLSWINAVGLVDADDRSAADITELQSRNIWALPCYSVEAIYYNPDVIRRIAVRQAALTGKNVDILVSAATNAVTQSLSPHRDRLCARLCERRVRSQVQSPTWQTIQNGGTFSVNLDLQAPLDAERARFDAYISNNDIQGLIQRYPIRETGAPTLISRALDFANRSLYEAAVRQLLTDDEVAKNEVRGMFGDMIAALSSPKIPDVADAASA